MASAESACKTLVECAHHSCTPESLAHYLCVEGGSLQEQEDASGLELLQYIAQRLASWGVSERETMERECVRRIRVTYLKLIEAVSAHEEVPSSSHRTQYYCGQGHQEGDGEEGGADSVQQTRTFFHVAIDCPGYGRSLGDCQVLCHILSLSLACSLPLSPSLSLCFFSLPQFPALAIAREVSRCKAGCGVAKVQTHL